MRLNKFQLQMIAIIAMVIDHIAWGFITFETPLALIMHVVGRLTIPIMSFFIVEGLNKTSNLKKYLLRLFLFGLVAQMPYHYFFKDIIGNRTNIIFDFYFGILMILVFEKTKLPKVLKWLAVGCLFFISARFGGWPILPPLLIISFYYGDTWKKKCYGVIVTVILTVICQMTFLYFDQSWHLLDYEHVWYSPLYLLGFILALYPLSLYNGEKGKNPLGRYFFYLFYPCHFIVLLVIQMLWK